MGAFAEFERNMIRSRQREGIDAAREEVLRLVDGLSLTMMN